MFNRLNENITLVVIVKIYEIYLKINVSFVSFENNYRFHRNIMYRKISNIMYRKISKAVDNENSLCGIKYILNSMLRIL